MENFPNNFSDVIQWEVEPNYTREEVTFASGTKFKLGDIVYKDADSGKYSLIAASKTAGGICISDEVDASTADAKGVILSGGPAIVLKQMLNYNSQADAAIDTTLAGLGIKVVEAKV